MDGSVVIDSGSIPLSSLSLLRSLHRGDKLLEYDSLREYKTKSTELDPHIERKLVQQNSQNNISLGKAV